MKDIYGLFPVFRYGFLFFGWRIGVISPYINIGDRMSDYEAMKSQVMNYFGQTAQINEHPTQKDEILSFSMNGVSLKLNMNSYWDERNQTYQEAVPSISMGYNKKYCSLPVDPETLKALGEFMMKMSEAAKSVPMRKRVYINDDLAEAKAKLQKYKTG